MSRRRVTQPRQKTEANLCICLTCVAIILQCPLLDNLVANGKREVRVVGGSKSLVIDVYWGLGASIARRKIFIPVSGCKASLLW